MASYVKDKNGTWRVSYVYKDWAGLLRKCTWYSNYVLKSDNKNAHFYYTFLNLYKL